MHRAKEGFQYNVRHEVYEQEVLCGKGRREKRNPGIRTAEETGSSIPRKLVVHFSGLILTSYS